MEWMDTYNFVRPYQSLDHDIPAHVFVRDIKNVNVFLEMGVYEVLA